MKRILDYIDEAIVRGKIQSQSPYKAVDLGLSVKWAECNVGATKPEDSGLLFQWGRTAGYKYGDKNNKFLSQDDYATFNKKYNNIDTLNLEDDTAHVNMGNKWRMPSEKEIEELSQLNNEWIEQNGVKGVKFVAKNGNSIFIPASGYFGGFCKGVFDYDNSRCYMWSSSIYKGTKTGSYYLFINQSVCKSARAPHYFAFSVRGVCE